MRRYPILEGSRKTDAKISMQRIENKKEDHLSPSSSWIAIMTAKKINAQEMTLNILMIGKEPVINDETIR